MKLKKILLIITAMFAFLGVTEAKIRDIDEVANGFNNTYIIKKLNESDANLSAKTKDNKFYVYSGSDPVLILDYTDDYIEYTDNTPLTEEYVMENFANQVILALSFEGIMESLLNLSGYQDKMLDYVTLDDNYTYETDGLLLQTEHYNYSSGDSKVEGDYIRHFKISLDDEKTKTLASKYAINFEEPEPQVESVPTLKSGNITDSSIDIHMNLDDPNSNKLTCMVYRSASKDGEYEAVSDWGLPCNNSSFTDSNLESGKSYYYKAKVQDGTNYSNVLAATTAPKGRSTSGTTANDKGKENVGSNPGTDGASIYIVIAGLIISLWMTIFSYKRHKSHA